MITNRRFFLMLLATQPLIMNSVLENPLKKILINAFFQEDANDFFIIGGWVLLKDDI